MANNSRGSMAGKTAFMALIVTFGVPTLLVLIIRFGAPFLFGAH